MKASLRKGHSTSFEKHQSMTHQVIRKMNFVDEEYKMC